MIKTARDRKASAPQDSMVEDTRANIIQEMQLPEESHISSTISHQV